jgi:hypothetical protein
MFCIGCGQRQSQGANFCATCGRPFEEAPKAESRQSTTGTRVALDERGPTSEESVVTEPDPMADVAGNDLLTEFKRQAGWDNASGLRQRGDRHWLGPPSRTRRLRRGQRAPAHLVRVRGS